MVVKMTKRALIITHENFTDCEVIYPFYRLKEAGFDVEIMSNIVGKCKGIDGVKVDSVLSLSVLKYENTFNNFMNFYDLLIIPGGVKAIEKLRLEKQIISFIKEWNTKGKVIASICHGAQLLISAKVVQQRAISGYYSIEDDIINAGGIFMNVAAAVDNNIVSSPHYKYMAEWMQKVLQVFNEKNGIEL